MVNRKMRLEVLRWIVWEDELYRNGYSCKEEWKRERLGWMRRGLIMEVINYDEFVGMYDEMEV